MAELRVSVPRLVPVKKLGLSDPDAIAPPSQSRGKLPEVNPVVFMYSVASRPFGFGMLELSNTKLD